MTAGGTADAVTATPRAVTSTAARPREQHSTKAALRTWAETGPENGHGPWSLVASGATSTPRTSGPRSRSPRRYGAAIRRGGFADPGWVERWDIAFADLYLGALEAALAGRRPSRPWEIAFGAPADLPALRHVLLGMNAHINYDLPQALVAVISDEEFGDEALVARRDTDHRAIDGVLASRVAAEGGELAQLTGPPPLLDQLLEPFSRLGTQRFLREARAKVGANAVALNQARGQGPGAYAARLAQLEELSAAKVTTLQAPGQVLLKLAVTGFGVRLPG